MTIFKNQFIGFVHATERISNEGENFIFKNTQTETSFKSLLEELNKAGEALPGFPLSTCNLVDNIRNPFSKLHFENYTKHNQSNTNFNFSDITTQNFAHAMRNNSIDIAGFYNQNITGQNHAHAAVREVNINPLQGASDGPRELAPANLNLHTSALKARQPPNDTLRDPISQCIEFGFNFDKCQFSKSDLTRVCKLILKYRDAISMSEDDLGYCDVIKHRIILKPDAKPVYIRARPVSHFHLKPLEQKLRNLQDQQKIQPCHSPWSSPIRIVEKKPLPGQKVGSLRITADYRMTNKQIESSTYNLPRISTILEEMKSAKYFSTIDIRSAFHQIAIHEDSWDITAFSTPFGTYSTRVIPQGLKVSPQFFSQTIYEIMGDIENLKLYLDDLLICSTTVDDHLRTLETVFQRLLKYNIKYGPQKTEIAKESVLFLGFLIDKNGIRINPKKTEAIEKWPEPTSKKEVLSFLGACSFYRNHIKGFSCIERPLRELTISRKSGSQQTGESPFVFTDAARQSFARLKYCMTHAPVLAFPDFDRTFFVQTDACKFGVGGILSQIDKKTGNEVVIKYASKKYDKHCQNYTALDLECLGATYCITIAFKCYLYANPKKFYLITDHKAMVSMFTANDSKRLYRYSLALQPYYFDIIYRPGVYHANCDALSRVAQEIDDGEPPLKEETIFEHIGTFGVFAQPPSCTFAVTRLQAQRAKEATDKSTTNVGEVPTEADTVSMLLQAQREDPILAQYVDALASNDPIRLKKVPAEYHLDKQGFLRHSNKLQSSLDKWGTQFVIPDKMRTMIVAATHDAPDAGHMSYERSLSRVIGKYYWPTMKKDIREWIKACGICNSRNKANYKYKQPMTPHPITAPGYCIQMDCLGPLTESPEGCVYVVAFIDYFTAYAIAEPIKDCKAETIARCLVNRYIYKLGAPGLIMADEASYHMGTVMTKVREIFGIDINFARPNHHQAIGKVEKFMSCLQAMLAKFSNERGDNWPDYVQAAMFAYNTSVQSSLKYSPHFLTYGRVADNILDRKLELPLQQNYSEIEGYAENLERILEESFEIAAQNFSDTRQKMIDRHNANLRSRNVSKGSIVRVYDESAMKLRSKKFQNCYRGPYIVLKVLKAGNLWLQLVEDPKSTPLARNFSDCKLCEAERKNYEIEMLNIEQRIENLKAKFGENTPDRFLSLFSRTAVRPI